MSVEERFKYVRAYTPPMGPGGLDAGRIVRMNDWCLQNNRTAFWYTKTRGRDDFAPLLAASRA